MKWSECMQLFLIYLFFLYTKKLKKNFQDKIKSSSSSSSDWNLLAKIFRFHDFKRFKLFILNFLENLILNMKSIWNYKMSHKIMKSMNFFMIFGFWIHRKKNPKRRIQLKWIRKWIQIKNQLKNLGIFPWF